MGLKIFSGTESGFFKEIPPVALLTLSEKSKAAMHAPVLGYYAFYSGNVTLFYGTQEWGVVIPMEVAETLTVVMPVSTSPSHVNGVIQAHWRSTDGTVSYTSAPINISRPGDVELIDIPAAEVAKFIDKTVMSTYSLKLQDDEQWSREIISTVAPRMVCGKPDIEGLIDGTLTTADYPQGLNTTIPAIENLREYNAITFNWRVTYDSYVIFELSETVQPEFPDDDLVFVVPTHAYTPYAGLECSLTYDIWLGAETDDCLRWSAGSTEFKLA